MQRWRFAGPLLLVVMAACPAPDRPDEAVTELPPATTPGTETVTPTPETAQAELREVRGSGISGEATVRQVGAQSSVMLTVRGAPPNARLQAHVHSGRCEQPGGVAAPLEPILTDEAGMGSSVTTLEIDYATLLDGQHYVQAHEPGGEPGAPVTCGDLHAAA